jgi:hypothetical protein
VKEAQKPSSVKSGAAAIVTIPATSSGCARAISSESHPPMEEPTSTCGPRLQARIAASASSNQSPIAPSSNRPSDWPCPEAS